MIREIKQIKLLPNKSLLDTIILKEWYGLDLKVRIKTQLKYWEWLVNKMLKVEELIWDSIEELFHTFKKILMGYQKEDM